MTDDWLNLPTIEFELTAVDPDLIALLRGPERPAQTRPIQLDYRTPVKLSWWRRVWLWGRRKPVPTTQRRLVIPNTSMAITDAGTGDPE